MSVTMKIRHFLHDTRAGATSLAAAAMTVMAVGGTALIVEYVWLIDQRVVLKTAADAAAVAATLEMNRQITRNVDIDDSTLEAELEEVARRYVELNLEYLPDERKSRALASLAVDARVNRATGSVDVAATADLGGTLFSRFLPLLGSYAGPPIVQTVRLGKASICRWKSFWQSM